MTTDKTMKFAKRMWKPVAGVAGLAIILVWAGGGCGAKVAPGKIAHEPGFALPEGAEAVAAEVKPAATRVDVIGTTASEEKINLSARIPTYVSEVFASAGDAVKKGQVLVTLDDREVREQLAAAEAQLAQAEAEFKRSQQLKESNATTDQALTASRAQYDAARAQVDRIKVMLTYAQITSPIDGMVTDRRIEVGDLANPGQVLLAVYAPDRMRLEASVPIRLVEKLAMGQDVDIALDRPARPLKGKVAEIVSEIDPQSRTQKVRIHIEDTTGDILPGTFGRLWVEEGRHDAIFIPASAVYRVGQLELVQLVQDGRVIRRMVKTGAVQGDRIEILSGLGAGDQVLAKPVKEG